MWYVNHLDKCGLAFCIQFGFKSSRSIAVLLTVVIDTSNRIAGAFNSSGAARAATLDTSKAFNWV